MLFKKLAIRACRRRKPTAGEARHDLAEDRGVIFGFRLASRALDAEHALGRNMRPVGNRRLGNTYSSGERSDAASGLDGLIESWIPHGHFVFYYSNSS